MITPTVLRPPAPALKLWLGALMLAVCETWINFAAASGLNWLLSVLATSLAFVYFRLAAGKPLHRDRLVALIFACLSVRRSCGNRQSASRMAHIGCHHQHSGNRSAC